MSLLNLCVRTFVLVAFFGVSLVHSQVVRVPDGLERGPTSIALHDFSREDCRVFGRE